MVTFNHYIVVTVTCQQYFAGDKTGDSAGSMSAVSDARPGDLELVRRFENTVELPSGPDELDSVERAAQLVPEPRTAAARGPSAPRAPARLPRGAARPALCQQRRGRPPCRLGASAPLPGRAPSWPSVDPDRGLELSARETKGPIASLLAIVYESLLQRNVVASARLPQEHLPLRVLRSHQERVARVVQHGDVRQSSQSAAPPPA